MSDRIVEHYERVAATYDEHWNANPDYVRRGARAMIDALRLIRSDAIADIGCGTGLYARQLDEQVRPEQPILCVDPVQAMLNQLPRSVGLRPLLATAEDVAERKVAVPGDRPLDAIILKESIHHVAAPGDVLDGLASLLSPHGRLLIVMLPTTIAHPLFRAAHQRFEESQPNPETIAELLAGAGLRTSVSYRTFHVAIERDTYIRMLQSRYMSVLGEFSEAELAAGVEQFRHAYRDPVVRFDDQFAFVRGWA